MINVSTITKQIKEWFEEGADLAGVTVVRSEFVNEDPGAASDGWVGIYRRSVDYDPRNLGTAPDNYEGDVIIDIVVQQTHMGNGEQAEDALEELIKDVLDRLVQIPKIHIDHFLDLLIEYTYLETDRATLYFQGAIITVTAEVSFEVK